MGFHCSKEGVILIHIIKVHLHEKAQLIDAVNLEIPGIWMKLRLQEMTDDEKR